MGLLVVRNLMKRFRSPEGDDQTILDIPAFDLGEREELALRGESGSGKTTFLHIISGIVRPDSGSIHFAGDDLAAKNEHALDRIRGGQIGYIFQTFNLLQGFTCLENLLLAMSFGAGPDRSRAQQLLERVGLKHRLHHYPRQLSTGQQQRVAVARALANRPKLVLADEPTGNLDAVRAAESLQLIRQVAHENGAALLLVSHDETTLKQFGAVRDFREFNRAMQLAEGTR